jgi:CBS domain-containing protein
MSNRKVLDQRVSGTQSGIPRHPRVELVTLKSLLSNDPSRLQCVGADTSLAEALKLMAEHDLRAVMVTDGGQLIGILSERDYVRCSVAATLAPTGIVVREAMTACDHSANLTDPVHECLRLLLDSGLRYLAVLDGGIPIGLLSLDDLLRATVAYLERVFKEGELDQRIVNLRGTYSC